jgi:hypothetical protein
VTVNGWVKPVPVIVTVVPPAALPLVAPSVVIVGGVTKVNRSAELAGEVPPAVVTRMSTVPADLGGAVAMIFVALSTVNAVAAAEPKSTAVAAVKPVPSMETLVPPSVLPLAGLIDVTAGATT